MIRRSLLIIICLNIIVAGRCSDALPDTLKVKPYLITAEGLDIGQINIPGYGAMPGLSIDQWGYSAVRCMAGDDSLFAATDYDDRQWPRLSARDSLTALNASVYWIRYHFRFDSTIDPSTLLLYLRSTGDADIWLDGVHLLRSELPINTLSKELASLPDSAWRFSFPLSIQGGGHPHLLAMRLATGEAGIPPLKKLDAALYKSGSVTLANRSATHAAIFLGVNAFIFLMTLIYWRLDKGDRVWPWFSALTATNAFAAFASLAVASDLGLARSTVDQLQNIGTSLLFAPLSLMILLLLTLLGRVNRRLQVLYSSASVVIIIMIATGRFGLLDHLTTGFGPIQIILIGILVILAFGVGIWFMVVTIRLSLRAMRTRGSVQWLGIGILFTISQPIIMSVYYIGASFPDTASQAPPEWLETITSYIGYVALPLSIIIALGIRSAHQNRLLARQRDALDLEVNERTAELRLERDRSEELLLNILPYEVAEELKQTGAAEPRHFDRATVMFTDFKGFTAMSEKLAPAELIAELNACFKGFDDIIAKRGIEKIKTIGDAYMCVGGMHDPKNSSPAEVVFAALEMQEFMQQRCAGRQANGLFAFEMRSGIHTGPVVAGIVGVKKFQYDIWGDTVNMASRMETNGEIGRVNISAGTYALVKDTLTPLGSPAFDLIHRGAVAVKGKGEVDMWFVALA